MSSVMASINRSRASLTRPTVVFLSLNVRFGFEALKKSKLIGLNGQLFFRQRPVASVAIAVGRGWDAVPPGMHEFCRKPGYPDSMAVSFVDERPIRVGISTCLLGERVRFDGGHKRDADLTELLGRFFEWVPVCPEVEVGMGVPREPVRLSGEPESPRMTGVKSGTDWTKKMREYSARRARELEGLDGYIFKSRSPSCGLERVKVYSGEVPAARGRGIYADAFVERHPLVPAEEEGRLKDPRIRENFIVRVFSHHRLHNLRERFRRSALVEFHTRHKYLLL